MDYIDDALGIRGWLLDLSPPALPVGLDLRCGDALLGTTIAFLDRPDIDKVVQRPTWCGFLIGWSRIDRAALQAAAPDAPVVFQIRGSDEAVPVVCRPLTASGLLSLVAAGTGRDRRPPFHELNDYLDIAGSGLFDEAWYRRTQMREAELLPPILHYLRTGEAAGAQPSPFFEPAAYAAEAGLEGRPGALLHYLRHGGPSGLPPGPFFDPAWYAATHAVPPGQLPLAHHMAHRHETAPNPWFDPAYYAAVAALPEDTADPFLHFMEEGLAAGLLPSAAFEPAAPGPPPPKAERLLDLVRRRARPDGDAAAADSAPEDEEARCTEEGAGEEAGAVRPPPSIAALVGLPERHAPEHESPERHAEAAAGEPAIGPAAAEPCFRPLEAGFAGAESHLLSLPADRRGLLLARAEREMEERTGAAAAGAALLVAVGRYLAGDRPGSARAQIAFLAAPAEVEPATLAEIGSRFAALNRVLYDDRNRDEAVQVYRLLNARGVRDYYASLRLLELALDAGDVPAAKPHALELERNQDGDLNVWGSLAVARYYQATGEKPKSLQILRRLPLHPATEAVAEAVIAHRLMEAGAMDAAATRLEAVGGSDLPEVFHARFRLAARRKDILGLALLLEDSRAERMPDWQLAEAMFLCIDPGQMRVGEGHRLLTTLYRLLEGRGTGSNTVVQARINFLLQQKRWDELGALFEEIEGSPIAERRDTLLRKVEFHCHAENLEEAERIYRDVFQGSKLSKWEGLTVLRLLSELGRWEEAGRILLAHVANGYGIGGAAHLAMRVVRKAEIHQELSDTAAGIAGESGGGLEPDLEEFLARVHEDLAILHRARAMATKVPARGTPARYRSNWILSPPDTGEAGQDEICLYLCANQRYFLSLLTFLCSFLGQSPQVGGRLFVFLDRDVPRHWHGSIAMVAARFGRAIDVVGEEEFMPAAVDHRTDYGFFAGGSALSRAAYFRLYAARYLLQRHTFRRAAYIDTDIICRGDLTGLFQTELGDMLLAARVEDYAPEVINAARRNGLNPNTYFNSGVLLLKCDDPMLPEVIEEAIRISETEPERLVFHDQCALNVAFRDRFTMMADRFNFFLRPSRERNGHIEDGVLLHFLDKPKPWDVVFDRSYREEWRVWALVLGSVLPQGLYVDIFAAANRD
ncbi:glycosyltransferase [Pararoseomonas sp. SCSIO 73927]|uniref:glycosyltransferase n=1 Tax=Pararoseomonas sp. SCSIO 73927 TaxID=3114537 RepID=UPI0030D460D8